MREKWSPKQKSNLVLNLIAELNSILKGNYFVSELFYNKNNKCCYTLEMTATGLNKRMKNLSFLQIQKSDEFSYAQMHIYLTGIINGLKVAEITNNNN